MKRFAFLLLLGAAPPLAPGKNGWKDAGLDAIRGITIGPIESAYHPGKGYGSAPYARTLGECGALGANWIALTPFGRVADLDGTGVDPTFETPFEKNRIDIARAIDQAHANGLRVMLVPHLWVENEEWRAKIDPKTDTGWARWAKSYGDWVKAWAHVAADHGVEMFSAGVELRSWVTTGRAPSFAALIGEIRLFYRGFITYSANWDDVDQTVVLGDLDVIGINAFYPLADHEHATEDELFAGGKRVAEKVRALAQTWNKPVLFTEIGYTTRADPAYQPWLWPEKIPGVVYDEYAQAVAYHALIAPLLDEPSFVGFFVWRVYADPDDVSQEPKWGFSPRGKLAENVVKDAFRARFAGDGTLRTGY